MNNLLSNAIENTPGGGSISCRAQEDGSWIKISVINDNNNLCREDLPHIFEAFWRKDQSRTDSAHIGLGLTLVATYAALSGGKVEAAIEPPNSVSLVFYLPRESEAIAVSG